MKHNFKVGDLVIVDPSDRHYDTYLNLYPFTVTKLIDNGDVLVTSPHSITAIFQFCKHELIPYKPYGTISSISNQGPS